MDKPNFTKAAKKALGIDGNTTGRVSRVRLCTTQEALSKLLRKHWEDGFKAGEDKGYADGISDGTDMGAEGWL